MTSEKLQKVAKSFYCEKCDFICNKKWLFEKHKLTLKHQNTYNTYNPDLQKKLFSCECGKEYSHRQSLYSHKKKCNNTNVVQHVSKDHDKEKIVDKMTEQNQVLIEQILEQNKQLKEEHNDLKKMIIDICKNCAPMNQYNSINSNNKTFNLNFFLNETCKDAMNLTDFVNSIQLQLSDLENVGKNGFVAGISNIIIENLKQLDVTQRPVHCSDQKRETIYVKDENQWFNDSKENEKLKNVIGQIAHKNICMIPEWKAKYPDCIYSDSRKSDQYNHIIYQSMSQNNENSEKIIKKIAKEVGIEK